MHQNYSSIDFIHERITCTRCCWLTTSLPDESISPFHSLLSRWFSFSLKMGYGICMDCILNMFSWRVFITSPSPGFSWSMYRTFMGMWQLRWSIPHPPCPNNQDGRLRSVSAPRWRDEVDTFSMGKPLLWPSVPPRRKEKSIGRTRKEPSQLPIDHWKVQVRWWDASSKKEHGFQFGILVSMDFVNWMYLQIYLYVSKDSLSKGLASLQSIDFSYWASRRCTYRSDPSESV